MTQTRARSPYLIPLVIVGVLALAMIGVLFWGMSALRERAELSRVTEPSTEATQSTTSPEPTEP